MSEEYSKAALKFAQDYVFWNFHGGLGDFTFNVGEIAILLMDAFEAGRDERVRSAQSTRAQETREGKRRQEGLDEVIRLILDDVIEGHSSESATPLPMNFYEIMEQLRKVQGGGNAET